MKEVRRGEEVARGRKAVGGRYYGKEGDGGSRERSISRSIYANTITKPLTLYANFKDSYST